MKKRAVLLLSTGIDSPVAGAILGEKGFDLVTLSFVFNRDQEDILERIVSRLRELSRGSLEALVAPHPFSINPEVATTAGKRACILCKRLMYMAASRIARARGYPFVATGESVGQVASQTIENLVAIGSGLGVDVLRPLASFDKEDATRKSRLYGLYELSIMDKTPCPFVPRFPETRATPEMVESLEKEMGRESLESVADRIVSLARSL